MEAQIHLYSPGCTSVPSVEGTVASPGKYDSNAALCQITLTTCYNTNNTLWCVFCEIYSLPSRRQHLSVDDCLEDKRVRLSELFYAVLCTTIEYSDVHTHMSSSCS